MFSTELEFFIDHQDELVRQYKDKVLVLQGERVVGVYDTELEAYLEAQKEYPLGSFMIQPCQPGVDAYTATIGSLESVVDKNRLMPYVADITMDYFY